MSGLECAPCLVQTNLKWFEKVWQWDQVMWISRQKVGNHSYPKKDNVYNGCVLVYRCCSHVNSFVVWEINVIIFIDSSVFFYSVVV